MEKGILTPLGEIQIYIDNIRSDYQVEPYILSEKTEFAYEEEIPLVVQIITSKNEVISYQVDYFNSPEEYEKYGYEGVFAITIRFSQKTVGELDAQ